jgi:BirA family biotin operon repressor/biotin-[acetyl-CoA-carboxylase] ligase
VDRSSLDIERLRSTLLGPGRWVTAVDVVAETTSTNTDLLTAAAFGAPEGVVLAAEYQNAGRGRFDRVWTSPPRAGLSVSVVLRPTGVPVSRWGWLALLAGVAAHAALRSVLDDDVEVWLKWPNDLLLGPDRGKVAGVLAQVGGGAVVMGIGINVDHRTGELPVPTATSLALQDLWVDRTQLLIALLDQLATRYRHWCAHGGDPQSSGLRTDYEAICDTVGRDVDVIHPSAVIAGIATAIDANGALIVQTATGPQTITAGDVVHIRPWTR